MKTTKIIVTAIVTTLFLILSAAPANAHYSSYCGHGSSGYWPVTKFVRHVQAWRGGGRINHVYKHVYGAWSIGYYSYHYDVKWCGDWRS